MRSPRCSARLFLLSGTRKTKKPFFFKKNTFVFFLIKLERYNVLRFHHRDRPTAFHSRLTVIEAKAVTREAISCPQRKGGWPRAIFPLAHIHDRFPHHEGALVLRPLELPPLPQVKRGLRHARRWLHRDHFDFDFNVFRFCHAGAAKKKRKKVKLGQISAFFFSFLG
jgi:hypothetical protein